ncbi:hypothetical protein PAPHI01_0977 [Pancytospora philotis]|nr:hypothetical protein PAPHI01_0977 [Pancytospora philotis]
MLLTTIKEGSGCLRRAFASTLAAFLRRDEMRPEEAVKIMDLPSRFAKKDLDDRFRKFYNANSAENGGSPYIQGKILAAYNILGAQLL